MVEGACPPLSMRRMSLPLSFICPHLSMTILSYNLPLLKKEIYLMQT